MSLINEALKRARDGSYRHGAVPAVAPAAYRVAAPARDSTATLRYRAVTGLIIVAVAAAVAAYRFFPRPAAVPAPVADVQAQEQQLVKQLLTPPPQPAIPLPEPVAPVAEPPAPPPRDPPALTLQGILRGGKFTEVMINGYTYRVGDEVSGAKVLAIEDSAVRLEFDGREFTLRMR